jgi:hypothetical protein
MELKDLLTIEAIALAIIAALFILILIKMRPLKDFSNVKIGKQGLELSRSGEYQKLLDFAKEFTERLDKISAESSRDIESIRERIDAQYKFIREAAINAGIGVVWSGTKAPFKETVKAGLKNIMLGENGNLVNRLVQVVMEEGKNGVANYESELNEFVQNNFTKPKKPVPEHFKTITKQIKDRIF